MSLTTSGIVYSYTMDLSIFLDGLAPKTTDRQLEKELKRPMQQLGIYGYSVNVMLRKPQRSYQTRNKVNPITALLNNMELETGQRVRELPIKGHQARILPPGKSNTAFAFVTVPRPEFATRFIQVPYCLTTP